MRGVPVTHPIQPHPSPSNPTTTGVPPGLQHAEPADSPQEPQLPAPGLQLQPQAHQDAYHQGLRPTIILL